jgi:hypothetical protein
MLNLNKKQVIPTATYAPVYIGQGEGEILSYLTSDYRAIVDTDNDKHVFSIMSNKYRIVQHSEALKLAEQAITKNPEFGEPTKKIAVLNEGGKMEVKYTFPDVEVDITGRGDKVNPQLIIRNSYDGGWKFGIMLGAFRLVCSNGLVIGKRIYMLKQMHYENLVLDRISIELENALHNFSIQTKIWEKWVDRVTTHEEFEDIVEKLNPSQKEAQHIIDEVEKDTNLVKGKLTLWMLYNIITAMITHMTRSQNKRINMEDKARKAFERFNQFQ